MCLDINFGYEMSKEECEEEMRKEMMLCLDANTM